MDCQSNRHIAGNSLQFEDALQHTVTVTDAIYDPFQHWHTDANKNVSSLYGLC